MLAGARDRRLPRAVTSCRQQERARPGLPDRRLPQPRGAGRDGPGDGARRRRRRRPRGRQRPGRRPVRRRASPGRTAGGCCAATRSARCSPTTCSSAAVTRAPTRRLDRVLARCSARWPPPPASRTPRRSPASSGSAGSTGLAFGYEEALGYCVRPRARAATRTASPRCCCCASWPPAAKADGRTLVDLLDDLARRHGLHATDQLSVRVSDLALIAAAMQRPARDSAGLARRPGRRGRRRPGARARPTCRRPTGCATGSPTAPGSWCARAAPSPS